MLLRKDKDFISMFDERTGAYLRTGVFLHGEDTGRDPFMASFPELLDVGIMGHCTHGKTGLCVAAGIQCYQGGFAANKPNMSLEDFFWIVEQCRGRTFQFALGGCGDPDLHECFPEILELCEQNRIVVNFTTSGFGLTKQAAELCARYCGAVAVSWYRSRYTLSAIERLLAAGVKTNIHYVLSRDTLDEAIARLQTDGFPKGVNAVIFLLHKPIGLGTSEQVIRTNNAALDTFLEAALNVRHPYRIGFDSCSVPALIRKQGAFDLSSIDTCEGARWSAYITADMKMLPCSFDNQDARWAVDLRAHNIEEAWSSPEFDDFRRRLRDACPTCASRESCMGGCPLCPDIVLCEQRQMTPSAYLPRLARQRNQPVPIKMHP